MECKNLVIIPARGGSKGVYRKNILKINDIPLINYTIFPVLELKKDGVIDEVIVSTDDEEIAEISKKTGVSVPFLRPQILATDEAKSVDVLIHALDFFEKKKIYFENVILLQPTTPLRKKEDILEAIDLFKGNKSESLISCYEEDYVCDLVSYHKEENYAVPLNKDHNVGRRRQENKKLYIRNGAIYITKSDYIKKYKKIISDMPIMYVMKKDNSVNIDTMYDLELVKWILSK